MTPQQVPTKFQKEQNKRSISEYNSVSVQKDFELKVGNDVDLTDDIVSISRSYNHMKVDQNRLNLEIIEDVDQKSFDQLAQNNLAIEKSAEGS